MGRLEEYRARFGRLLDIPQNAFGKTATVEIRGFHEILVQGCTGILDYSSCLVVLDSPQGKIVISGKDMRINVFSEDRLVIFGTVESICKGENDGKTVV